MYSPLQFLQTRFSYQFKSHIGIGIARGWAQDFVQLCEDIDKVASNDPTAQHYGFHWRQIKEKFGTARLYYQMGDSGSTLRLDLLGARVSKASYRLLGTEAQSVADATNLHPTLQIQRQVQAAQSHMAEICIVCGAYPAELDVTGGYALNLCERHTLQRKADRHALDSPWFKD